jgi:hypothetical protein
LISIVTLQSQFDVAGSVLKETSLYKNIAEFDTKTSKACQDPCVPLLGVTAVILGGTTPCSRPHPHKIMLGKNVIPDLCDIVVLTL